MTGPETLARWVARLVTLVAVVALVVAALEVLRLLKGLDIQEAVIGLPVLVLLLRARPAFTARRGARSWARTGLVAVVALLGASETGAQARHAAGLDAWGPGDEAIIDTATFSLEMRAVRGVGQAVARVGRG